MFKKIVFIIALFISCNIYSQTAGDSIVVNEVETLWDQGIPVCPDDPYISNLIDQIGFEFIRDSVATTIQQKKILCDLGLAFYARQQYEAADWYLAKSIAPINVNEVVAAAAPAYKEYNAINSRTSVMNEIRYVLAKPITIFKTVIKEPEISTQELEGMKKDVEFLNSIPKTLDNMSKQDLAKLAKQIEIQIKRLSLEKDSLIKAKATKEAISAKEGTINTLKSEKEVIDLNIQNSDLSGQNKNLSLVKSKYARFLVWAGIIVAILILVVLILSQRKTIKSKDLKILSQLKDIIKKNNYLEHAAKLIRHDMHSGINTYMPRGLNTLEKRLSEEEAKNLKIDTSIRMIKEGLTHTQKVYKSVYEFTNLVKQNIVLEKANINLKDLLERYLLTTSYKSQVVVESLNSAEVNETLFCNAIDNLIRNGLKYNNSDNKLVKVYMEENYLVVEDNGQGMTPEDFNKHINKTDSESGIGLGISASILSEHGFELMCEKVNVGTKLKIKLK